MRRIQESSVVKTNNEVLSSLDGNRGYLRFKTANGELDGSYTLEFSDIFINFVSKDTNLNIVTVDIKSISFARNTYYFDFRNSSNTLAFRKL